MKKTVFALALGLMMSTATFAQNRQITTDLPQEMIPFVTVTIGGHNQDVKPTKVHVKEIDGRHVECTIYVGEDKASVKLPMSYDTFLQLCQKNVKSVCSNGWITEEQKQIIETTIEQQLPQK